MTVAELVAKLADYPPGVVVNLEAVNGAPTGEVGAFRLERDSPHFSPGVVLVIEAL